MKSRKITDKSQIVFEDGSTVEIESEYKATVYDCENTTSEAYAFVNSLNVSHTVKKGSIIDDLLSALDKASEKCEPEREIGEGDPTWFGLG